MEKALLAKSIRDFEKAISMVSKHKRCGWECEQAKMIYKTLCTYGSGINLFGLYVFLWR